MKTKYTISATRKTLIRWAAWEFGVANAKRMLDSGTAFNIFGACNNIFKTKKAAQGLAERIEMAAAFNAGKLGKKDFEIARVVSV